jgi:carboxypeptidase Q
MCQVWGMKSTSILLFIFLSLKVSAQNNDSATIRKIFTEALTAGKSYDQLRQLCNIGPRLSGSENAAKAVEWGKKVMEEYDFDTVYLQEVMVPHWVRGDKEIFVPEKAGSRSTPPKYLNICALGGSIGTPEKGIRSSVIEVKQFEDLEKLGRKQIEGKIVFFNRPMDPTHITTFPAYGGAVNQRGSGAVMAAKYGAVAVIVRSMSLALDDFPHTGAMRYDDSITKIPAAAISTNGAEYLSELIKLDPEAKFTLTLSCQTLPDVKSYNVIGEIKGSQNPGEILVVGGHLDSWDLGEGAHDDGAGCVQSIEALRLFKALKIKPVRTLRAVLFMNEENGLRGGKKYAELAKANKEKHILAIESDAGGFAPRGFDADCTDEQLKKLKDYLQILTPYGIHFMEKGGSGADIGPLKDGTVALLGLRPESQRYFDYHHAASDTFDKVNKRELELGGAAMAAILYLISENGW